MNPSAERAELLWSSTRTSEAHPQAERAASRRRAKLIGPAERAASRRRAESIELDAGLPPGRRLELRGALREHLVGVKDAADAREPALDHHLRAVLEQIRRLEAREH